MVLLLSKKKLTAAASSMHQFCQEVRAIFPGLVDDAVVEATTVFLYLSVAEDLFGNRFRAQLARAVGQRLKYGKPADLRQRLVRVRQRAEALEKGKQATAATRDPEEQCRAHVTAVIESMLLEAGFNINDQDVIRAGYTKFENVVRDMKRHLDGIKQQNIFLFRKAS